MKDLSNVPYSNPSFTNNKIPASIKNIKLSTKKLEKKSGGFNLKGRSCDNTLTMLFQSGCIDITSRVSSMNFALCVEVGWYAIRAFKLIIARV